MANRIFFRITANVTEPDISEYFGQFGKITDLYMPVVAFTNKPKGVAYVSFETKEELDAVLAKKDHMLKGELLRQQQHAHARVAATARPYTDRHTTLLALAPAVEWSARPEDALSPITVCNVSPPLVVCSAFVCPTYASLTV